MRPTALRPAPLLNGGAEGVGVGTTAQEVVPGGGGGTPEPVGTGTPPVGAGTPLAQMVVVRVVMATGGFSLVGGADSTGLSLSSPLSPLSLSPLPVFLMPNWEEYWYWPEPSTTIWMP